MFQSTPPHGGRHQFFVVLILGFCFNPRPRTGGDLPGEQTDTGLFCFNPRPRTGGDLKQYLYLIDLISFNPRPRTGGDLFILLMLALV